MDDLMGIEISGGNFIDKTELDLFLPSKDTNGDFNLTKPIIGTLVFGKNGSGKTTIAKAFKFIKNGDEINNIETANFYDRTKKNIIPNSEYLNNIYVFDEEFINKNILLKKDGLKTIVMLGDQVDLTNDIEENKKLKDELTMEKEKETNNTINIKSEDTLSKIENKLKGEGNWSDRDRKIKGHRQNTPVHRYITMEKIVNKKNKSKLSEIELLTKFSIKESEMNKKKSDSAKIKFTLPNLSKKYLEYNDSELFNELNKKIKKPKLTDREKEIIKIMKNEKDFSNFTKREEMFNSSDISICPWCFQDLDKDYKIDTEKSIKKILNKDVKEYQGQISYFKLDNINNDEININREEYKEFPQCLKIKHSLEELNEEIDLVNKNIEEKLKNPYDFLPKTKSHIKIKANNFYSNLKDLETEIESYNIKLQDTKKLEEELILLNNQIAYCEIIVLYNSYKSEKKEEKDKEIEKEKKLTELEDKLNEIKKKLDLLDAKRKSYSIANDEINDYLSYIFCDGTRLKLEYDENGYYKLLSNGKYVRPDNVSLGERNIIGLCYFFAHILEGKEESNAFLCEYLIVIDDPISSFDFENKVGIISFLKYILSKFVCGNIRTNTVILTHDLGTYFDLNKVYDELSGLVNEKVYYNKFNLVNKQLEKQNKNYNEYDYLLKKVYEFGNGEIDNAPGIGNSIRQVLEAFSTFEYKVGITEISTNEKILDSLEDENYKKYFGNRMFRLVLNGDSHREDQIRAMKVDFFESISKSEKVRTARDVICFIYLLNKNHIYFHLKKILNNERFKDVINSWCEEIPNI